MPFDIMSLLGGGQQQDQGDEEDPMTLLGGGLSHRDNMSLALISALRQQQQSGMQRTATPIGSIVNAIAPLITAPIEARAADRQAQVQALPFLLQMAQLRQKLNPEKDAAELAKMKAETDKLSEETASSKSKRAQQDALIKSLGLDGGGGGGTPKALGGMKPTITMGPNGPSVTYRDDTLSSEALAQRQSIARAGQAQILERQKDWWNYQAQHPKATAKMLDAMNAADNLESMLGDVDSITKTIPKEMGRGEFAKNMLKYQARAEHPDATNFLTGVTGGLITADSDPRLDAYASWIGQAQAALAQFSMAGLRGGGFKTLQYLRAHFPGYADSPEQAAAKVKFLSSNKSLVTKMVTQLKGQLQGAASVAEETGGTASGNMVRKQIRNKKTGQMATILFNPDTGETMADDGQDTGDTDAAPTP